MHDPCWIDCGLNIPSAEELPRFRDELDAAEAAGVERFVIIASDIEQSRQAIAFAEADQRCVVTAGIHPHQADHASADFIDELRELCEHPSVRAIGECGLDYNRNYSSPENQRRVFASQVELAVELQLPLYLHEREAIDDQLNILRPAAPSLAGLFTHCFTGGVDELSRYQALSVYVGITGWVCDERRGQALATAVPQVDLSKLLLETDAPYLLPRSLRPRPKSRRNKPQHLLEVANRVAALSGLNLDQLKYHTWHNATRLFGEW